MRFPIAALPYTERISCATFNFRAGYTAEYNYCYAKETVIATYREYTPSPFLPTPMRPSLWVVPTVHLVLSKKGEEEVCDVTPNSEAAKLVGVVGVLKQHHKKAGGVIKLNTNVVKNLATAQAFPGDNVDEGSSPEPPAKKANQSPSRRLECRSWAGAVLGPGRAVGRLGRGPAARPPRQ
eukprot:jgi/Tetstr1/443869/TSEL_031822.t1